MQKMYKYFSKVKNICRIRCFPPYTNPTLLPTSSIHRYSNDDKTNFQNSFKQFSLSSKLNKKIEKVFEHDSDIRTKQIENIIMEDKPQYVEEIITAATDKNWRTKVVCQGCGARLQCADKSQPGFVSKEQTKLPLEILKQIKCKRCCAIDVHNYALTTTIHPSSFKKIVANRIRLKKNASVIFLVDITNFREDMFNIFEETVNKHTEVVLVGNKIDLIPPDAYDYKKRICNSLQMAGQFLNRGECDTHLISAKTGYGIENLISALQALWQSKRDIFLVGSANAGKSTLFNILLNSDLCASLATEHYQRATVSMWPGTTLNMLKFPLERISPARRAARHGRLSLAKTKTQPVSTDGYLSGSVAKSFVFGLSELQTGNDYHNPFELDVNMPDVDKKYSKWFYDTPGIMDKTSALSHFNKEELEHVIPKQPYKPRIFRVSPNEVLSYGGIGRIEYVQGSEDLLMFVFGSQSIPVVIATNEITNKHFPLWVDSGKLQVPCSLNRHKELGSFRSCDIALTSEQQNHVISDITFAATGWVTVVMPNVGTEATLTTHCLCGPPLQRQPLLPGIMRLKGSRILGTPEFKLRKDFDKLFVLGNDMFKPRKRRGDKGIKCIDT